MLIDGNVRSSMTPVLEQSVFRMRVGNQRTRMRAEAEADLANSIERRKQQALDRIAQSEAQALKDVRNTAVDVALAAAEKLIRENVGQAQQQALADKAIAELPKRLN